MIFDLKRFGNNVALICEDRTEISYQNLDHLVREFQARFSDGKGLLLLEADNSVDSIVAYLAGIASNCPVLITEPGQPSKIEDIKLTFSILYHFVAPTNQFYTNHENTEIEIHPDLALMLSTSGSTGTAKYVCLSQGNICKNAHSIVDYLELSEYDRAPTCLPFFYSYGLSVVNTHLIAGGSILITNLSVMDETFWKLFDQYNCTSFAGVPYTYEVLDNLTFKSSERKSLRYCTVAGGKLSKELILKNAECAKSEGWKFYVMYGQTEASPRMSYLPSELTLSHPDSIGLAISGGKFHLEDTNGNLIDKTDTHGELVFTGPNVMMGYAFNDEDLRNSPGEAILRTGDIAFKCDSGLYNIVGRNSRFIKLYGLRVSLASVEEFLAKRKIKAVCNGTDQYLGVLTSNSIDKHETALAIAKWLNVPPVSVQVHVVNEIPLQTSGKINFQQVNLILEEEYEKLKSSKNIQENQNTTLNIKAIQNTNLNEQILIETFSRAVGCTTINEAATLRDVGADSLSIVHVRIELEKYITDVPERWIDLTITELAELFSDKEKSLLTRVFNLKNIEVFIALRAIAIFCVVAHHYEWFFIPGGTTTLLFVISGYIYLEANKNIILKNGNALRLWGGMIVLLVTVIPISIFMAIVHSIVGTNWHITLLIPYENIVYYLNDVAGTIDTFHHVHWLWFIHAYIQIFILIAFILSFKGVRRYLTKAPYKILMLCFITSELLGVLVVLLDTLRTSDLRHSGALLQYSPTSVFPVVIFGSLIAFTKSKQEYVITCAAAISYIVINYFGIFTQGGITTLVTLVMLLFMKTIKVPAFLLWPLLLLSEASIFIYLTHMPMKYAYEKLFNLSLPLYYMVIPSIVISVLLWKIWKLIVVERIRRLDIFA